MYMYHVTYMCMSWWVGPIISTNVPTRLPYNQILFMYQVSTQHNEVLYSSHTHTSLVLVMTYHHFNDSLEDLQINTGKASKDVIVGFHWLGYCFS